MAKQLTCPGCNQQVPIGDRVPGQWIRCPDCLTEVLIPEGTAWALTEGAAFRPVVDMSRAPQPMRPRRTREDDDEWLDGPVRRRGVDPEAAASRVKPPALAMLLVALLGLVLALGMVAGGLYMLDDASGDEDVEDAIVVLVISPFVFVVAAICTIGAMSMLRRRRYGLAFATAILLLVSGIMFYVTLPFGIWAMVVLCDRNVKASFK